MPFQSWKRVHLFPRDDFEVERQKAEKRSSRVLPGDGLQILLTACGFIIFETNPGHPTERNVKWSVQKAFIS